MRRRRLGNSDLDISLLGLGAWAIGGDGWQFSWGPQDDASSIAAIRRAVEHGVNWIDTAAIYGLGHSEEVVARALEGLPDRPLVFTKCGLVQEPGGSIRRELAPASLTAEIDASLRRLRVEVIDLYQVHWPDDGLEEAWQTLADLKRQGKVRWLGVSNFDEGQLARVSAIAPVTSLQPPYSLLDRKVEARTLPWAGAKGIGVISYSPMYSGLLSGAMSAERARALAADDWRRKDPEFQGTRLDRNLRLVALLETIGAAHGASAGEVAIAWTLRNPAITGAIVGARSAAQVDGWIKAADVQLTAQDAEQVDRFLAANPLPPLADRV